MEEGSDGNNGEDGGDGENWEDGGNIESKKILSRIKLS